MNDTELFDKILKDKEDYMVWVNNNIIFAEHRIDKTSYKFSIYGKEMIVFLLRYFGIDAINIY